MVEHIPEKNKKDCIYLECALCPIMQHIACLTSCHNGLADSVLSRAERLYYLFISEHVASTQDLVHFRSTDPLSTGGALLKEKVSP